MAGSATVKAAAKATFVKWTTATVQEVSIAGLRCRHLSTLPHFAVIMPAATATGSISAFREAIIAREVAVAAARRRCSPEVGPEVDSGSDLKAYQPVAAGRSAAITVLITRLALTETVVAVIAGRSAAKA